MPDVVARIFDPQRADIYRRYGIQTFAPTAWSVGKIVELIVSPNLEREMTFGNGEVQLMAAWVPEHLVGKPIGDLAVPGEIRVALHRAHGQGADPGVGHDLRRGRPGPRGDPPVGRREVPEDDGVEVMRIVIAGAGTLGRRVATYTRDDHDVARHRAGRARARAPSQEELGVKVLVGDADEPSVLARGRRRPRRRVRRRRPATTRTTSSPACWPRTSTRSRRSSPPCATRATAGSTTAAGASTWRSTRPRSSPS